MQCEWIVRGIWPFLVLMLIMMKYIVSHTHDVYISQVNSSKQQRKANMFSARLIFRQHSSFFLCVGQEDWEMKTPDKNKLGHRW